MSEFVTATALAAHLDISRPRVMQLLDEGVLARLDGKLFNLDDSRRAYIRWLRAPERRARKTEATERFDEARARRLELANAREEAGIMDLAEHDAVIGEIIGMFAGELAQLPARATSDITVRTRIAAACANLGMQIADQAAHRRAQLGATGQALDAVPND